jgi:CRP-like cAMP-binding protein
MNRTLPQHSTPPDLAELIQRALPNSLPDSRHALARTARIGRLDPNEIMFRQGEPMRLTLIIRGHAAFRRTTIDGRQLVLGVVAGGDIFGFSSVASLPSPVDLVALSEGKVAAWSGDELRPLVAGDSGLALDMIDGMSRLAANTVARVDGFIHQGARMRVLRVLAQYEELIFGPSAVLSRAYLPSLVGTSREMTGRVLRQLEREGLIARVGRRGLKLRSPAGLHHEVGSAIPESD